MIEVLNTKCIRVNIKLICAKGIELVKKDLKNNLFLNDDNRDCEEVHAFAEFSSTGKLEIAKESNIFRTQKSLRFTQKGELFVFWDIEPLTVIKNFKETHDESSEKNSVTEYINEEQNVEGDAAVSLPLVLNRKEDENSSRLAGTSCWKAEYIDIHVGLLYKDEKVTLGCARVKLDGECFDERKVTLHLKPVKSGGSKVVQKLKRFPSFKSSLLSLKQNLSINKGQFPRSVFSLFQLNPSKASIDLELEVIDTMPVMPLAVVRASKEDISALECSYIYEIDAEDEEHMEKYMILGDQHNKIDLKLTESTDSLRDDDGYIDLRSPSSIREEEENYHGIAGLKQLSTKQVLDLMDVKCADLTDSLTDGYRGYLKYNKHKKGSRKSRSNRRGCIADCADDVEDLVYDKVSCGN